ncbi:MarR family winged helix-turn-helix transcriptional regulator [Novilysobacter antarcticus]|uniref:MarR family winged helix-turn-helix transcriptional regulator n=1 Tax=Novilysobacter antarcticus TaxID=2862543 RepID=UPI001FEBDEEB|nr:MarR family transcriptional regulator [Lysobacter antarcticus]
MTSTLLTGSTLGLLFRQVRDAMWARMARELEAAGHQLTFSQYATLKLLAQRPCNAAELARSVDLDRGAMSRLLDRLETRELVARVPDPKDGRAWHVVLTPCGQALWKDVNHCGTKVRECALNGLSDREREQLSSLLNRVCANLSTDESC